MAGRRDGHRTGRGGRDPPAGPAGQGLLSVHLRGAAGARPGGRSRGWGARARRVARCAGGGGRREGPPMGQASVCSGARGMTVHGGLLRLRTPGNGYIVDITDGVAGVVRTAGVQRGLVCAFAVGSTVAITTMEYEPGGVHDFRDLLDRLIP